jgi:hypothetical protein
MGIAMATLYVVTAYTGDTYRIERVYNTPSPISGPIWQA